MSDFARLSEEYKALTAENQKLKELLMAVLKATTAREAHDIAREGLNDRATT